MKLYWTERNKTRAIDRLEKVVAVPPNATGPIIAKEQVAGKTVHPEADTFIEAGWSFVPAAEAVEPDANTRAVYVDNSGKLYIDGRRLTVRFQPTISQQRITQMLGEHGLVLKRKLGFAPNSYIVAPADSEQGHADIVELAREVGSEPEVDYASPSFIEAMAGRSKVA